MVFLSLSPREEGAFGLLSYLQNRTSLPIFLLQKRLMEGSPAPLFIEICLSFSTILRLCLGRKRSRPDLREDLVLLFFFLYAGVFPDLIDPSLPPSKSN